MKIETLQKRIIKAIKDNRLQNTKALQLLKEFSEIPKSNGEQYRSYLINVKCNTIRAYIVKGRGKHINAYDYRDSLEKLFDMVKLKYELKNDAPRGGRHGYFYLIKTKIIR